MKKYLNQSCLLLAFLFFLIGQPVAAQEIIDEDFLETLEVNAKTLWDEKVPAFTVTAVPEQYKKESAVIMGYRRMVRIDKKSLQ